MPKYLRSAADFLAQFIELDAPPQIIRHQAEILRRRITICLDQLPEVDKLGESSTLSEQEPTKP